MINVQAQLWLPFGGGKGTGGVSLRGVSQAEGRKRTRSTEEGVGPRYRDGGLECDFTVS